MLSMLSSVSTVASWYDGCKNSFNSMLFHCNKYVILCVPTGGGGGGGGGAGATFKFHLKISLVAQ